MAFNKYTMQAREKAAVLAEKKRQGEAIVEAKKSVDDILSPHVQDRLRQRVGGDKIQAVKAAIVRGFKNWNPRGLWALKITEGNILLAILVGEGNRQGTLLSGGMNPREGSEIREVRF